MKKFFFMAVVAFMTLLSACGSQGAAEGVAKKIDNHEQLTQEDFGVMLDYITPELEQMVKLIEMGADDKDVEALNKEFPLTEVFLPAIMQNEQKFDEANKKKSEKIAQLYMEAFRAAAKKQGVNFDEFNQELPAELPAVDSL
ncbi:MAG: hypothetical protein K2M67_02515 [Muribaculaceae bacterium]|nr:hypothetical protein [Bacteroides sp.]MDE7495702.1 hypothetical protein [Muribaculaceae bacterium]